MMYLAGSQEVIYDSNNNYNSEHRDFAAKSAIDEVDIAAEVGSDSGSSSNSGSITGVLHMRNYVASSSSSESSQSSIEDSNSNAKKNVDVHGRHKHHHERAKPGRAVNTLHLEMLFETYLNEIEWIASEIEGLQDNITNTGHITIIT